MSKNKYILLGTKQHIEADIPEDIYVCDVCGCGLIKTNNGSQCWGCQKKFDIKIRNSYGQMARMASLEILNQFKNLGHEFNLWSLMSSRDKDIYRMMYEKGDNDDLITDLEPHIEMGISNEYLGQLEVKYQVDKMFFMKEHN